MRSRILRVTPPTVRRVCLGLVLLLSIPVAAVEALYRMGLREVGSVPPPPGFARPLSQEEQTAGWLDVGERLPLDVARHWPWHSLFELLDHSARPRPCSHHRPGFKAAAAVARLWLVRSDRPHPGLRHWHLKYWATTVWLTRHWSAAELTQALAAHAARRRPSGSAGQP